MFYHSLNIYTDTILDIIAEHKLSDYDLLFDSKQFCLEYQITQHMQNLRF